MQPPIVTRFLMRHMSNALNDDMEYHVGEYIKTCVDDNFGHYKDAAYKFFEENDVENPRQCVATIFGTGENKFWCFEHNLLDVPMYTMNTVYDVIDTLENVQKELIGEGYTPNHKFFNLWCCTADPYMDLVVSDLHMTIEEKLNDVTMNILNDVCNVSDNHPDDIIIDEDGRWIDTKEFDDAINEKVYGLIIGDYMINRDLTYKFMDMMNEKYPHHVVVSDHDDIRYYEFINVDDTKTINIKDFYKSIDSMKQLRYNEEDDSTFIIDGVDLLEPYVVRLKEILKEKYDTLYDEQKRLIDEGVVDFPKKKTEIYFR